MSNNPKTMLSLAAAAFALLLLGCSYHVDEVDYKGDQKPAAILIADPQVYARASLINDRREEQEYLHQLLDNSAVDKDGKSVVTFAPQIIRDLKTIEALSANLGINAGALSAVTPSNAADLDNQIAVAKLQEQLAVLQKQTEAIQNAAAPQVTIPAPDMSTPNATTPAPTVTMPDLTALHTQIKDIQAQLKDLATTSVSGPAAPSNNYGGLADPRDEFNDRQAYRRDIRAALAEAQLDDVHDRSGNALYRLQFQATVLPPDGNNKQWGATRMDIKAPSMTKEDVVAAYYSWLGHISQALTETRSSAAPNYDYVRYVAHVGHAGYFRVVDLYQPYENDGNSNYFCLDLLTASDAQLKAIDSQRSRDGVPFGMLSYAPLHGNVVWYQKVSTFAIPTDLIADGECPLYPGMQESSLSAPLIARLSNTATKFIQEEMVQSAAQRAHGFSSFFSFPLQSSTTDFVPRRFCLEILEHTQQEEASTDKTCTGLFSAERPERDVAGGNPQNPKDYLIKSYSVLPAELAQRLGVSTESSQSLQTALSIAGQVSVATSLGLDAGYLSQTDARAEALARQPLVVGFAGSDYGTDADANTNTNATQTYFGWLFGPQFVVKDSKSLTLQNGARRYGVNADISVPGWWDSFDLDVQSAWVSNWSNGQVLDRNAPQGQQPLMITKHVALPISDVHYEALTNYIGAKEYGFQYSRIFASSVTPDVIPACASTVTFQIGGANIWRAGTVFLGGAEAKNVTVMPDMNGVAAEFDMNDVFGAIVKSDNVVQVVPLTVSAEQGSTGPIPVFVVGSRQTANAATSCQSPLMMPTSSAALPPTVFFTSAEMCTTDSQAVITLQGINLPKGVIEDDGKNYEITVENSDLFAPIPQSLQTDINGSQLIAVLKRKQTLHKGTVPIILSFFRNQLGQTQTITVKLTIDDCSGKDSSSNSGTAHGGKIENPVKSSVKIIQADAGGGAQLNLQIGALPTDKSLTAPYFLDAESGGELRSNGATAQPAITAKGIQISANSVLTITLGHLADKGKLALATKDSKGKSVGSELSFTIQRTGSSKGSQD